MKKAITVLLSLVLVVLLCGCGASDDAAATNETALATITPTVTTTEVNMLDSIKACFNTDSSYKISYEYMNLVEYGFSRDIEQKLCQDGSFSYFISSRQWNHLNDYDVTENREFYYRYEDGIFVCYMKTPEGDITRGEVTQEVLDSMAADRVRILSSDALIPDYAQDFTEVVAEKQYAFSLPVKDVMADDNFLSVFLDSIFTASGYEYDSSLDLNIVCTIDVSKNAEGEIRPLKISYDFEEIKPFVLSSGALSGEYALDANLITMTYEFNESLGETVEIPEEFLSVTLN